MNEALANRIAAEHDAGKHKKAPRLDCWACGKKLIRQEVPRTSLYPERELVQCRRCNAEHFKGGRCFAEIPGWVSKRPRPAARMTPAETRRAIKQASEKAAWWAK